MRRNQATLATHQKQTHLPQTMKKIESLSRETSFVHRRHAKQIHIIQSTLSESMPSQSVLSETVVRFHSSETFTQIEIRLGSMVPPLNQSLTTNQFSSHPPSPLLPRRLSYLDCSMAAVTSTLAITDAQKSSGSPLGPAFENLLHEAVSIIPRLLALRIDEVNDSAAF